jgi:hypothetical protein
LVCRSGGAASGLQKPLAMKIAIVLATLAPAFAQNLSMGGVAGSNFTPNFQPAGPSYTNTRSWIAGAVAEWSLAAPVSIETNVLYRQLHILAGPSSHFSVVTWEFPILAKFRLGTGRMLPFVEAGPSLRATGNLNDIHPSHYGFTAGIGAERQLGRWRIEPALRYTRWAQDLEAQQAAIRTKPDQLELLVGLRAPTLANQRPFGARFSLGAVVGANLTGDYGSVASTAFPPALANSVIPNLAVDATFVSSAGPRSFVGGPEAAVQLSQHFAIAVQGIYRPLRSSVQVLEPGTRHGVNIEAHRTTWEFPALAQYHWRGGRAAPFIEMGPSFRLLQDVYGASPFGIAAGTGVETHLGRLKIAPGLRFTHWAQDDPPALTNPRRSELAILTGFSL